MKPQKSGLWTILLALCASASASAQPVYPYKLVAAPKTAVSHHRIYGTIGAVQGSQLTVQTRRGAILVDASNAQRSGLAVLLLVGRVVEVKGNYDGTGTLHANVILRAKSSPFLWKPDT